MVRPSFSLICFFKTLSSKLVAGWPVEAAFGRGKVMALVQSVLGLREGEVKSSQ